MNQCSGCGQTISGDVELCIDCAFYDDQTRQMAAVDLDIDCEKEWS